MTALHGRVNVKTALLYREDTAQQALAGGFSSIRYRAALYCSQFVMQGSLMFARRKRTPQITLEPLPDGLPKRGLFAEPVRITRLTASHELYDAEQVRVTFLTEIRDASERRCSDLFVEALIDSPERQRLVSGTTDLLGRIRFRIVGGAGVYTAAITNVGANGLQWDDASQGKTLSFEVNL